MGLSNLLWKKIQFTYGEHQIEINIIFSFWFVGACHKYIVTKSTFTILRHTLFRSIKGKLIVIHWGTIDLEWMSSPLNPCSSTCVVQTSSTNNIFHIFLSKKFIYCSSICIHVAKYSATSTKILSNVARNIRNIFHPCHQKVFKNIPSCSHTHVHKFTPTLTSSQYNIIDLSLWLATICLMFLWTFMIFFQCQVDILMDNTDACWHTPKLLGRLSCESKCENSERIRS